MYIAASGNSLTERHACTCKQIPLPESLHEKLGYAQSRTTKDGGNLCHLPTVCQDVDVESANCVSEVSRSRWPFKGFLCSFFVAFIVKSARFLQAKLLHKGRVPLHVVQTDLRGSLP